MVKTIRKCHILASFSKRFEYFRAVITSKLFFFNYPWLTYVKLIIGAGNQNLLTDTK